MVIWEDGGVVDLCGLYDVVSRLIDVMQVLRFLKKLIFGVLSRCLSSYLVGMLAK